jgi:hypothetical protein
MKKATNKRVLFFLLSLLFHGFSSRVFSHLRELLQEVGRRLDPITHPAITHPLLKLRPFFSNNSSSVFSHLK